MVQPLQVPATFMNTGACCKCGIEMVLPQHYYNSRKVDHATFYCLNGHKQYYPGESDVEEANRLRRNAENDAERHRVRRKSAEKSAAAYRGQVTRIKRRVGKGVCPCCNHTFKNLADHMETKHPDYSKGGE